MSAPEAASSYTFKIAESDDEFEQVFKLNYQTFVEEIPQHKEDGSGMLVDKFHDQNTYLIGLKDGQMVGMMALRDQRPFSLDTKVPDLDQYLPENRSIVEIRLLSVVPTARRGRVLRGLLALLVEHNQTKNWNLAVISGTTRQQKLYSHLGFVPFGPLVGTEGAYYQPMYVDLESFQDKTRRILAEQPEIHNFLPGPVPVSAKVSEAFARHPVSHRSSEFHDELRNCEDKLKSLTGSTHALIALGSGTLANDMIAAHLSRLGQKGIILSNGEFGQRLIKQSRRHGLEFDLVEMPWGKSLDIRDLETPFDSSHQWLWMAACETSTGMKNDIGVFADWCEEHGIKFCVDCVSAVGAYPLDLSKAYLASGTSGKAIAGYPGLALVFHNHKIASDDSLPGYLDIGYYYLHRKVPFTHSSNLVCALSTALAEFEDPSNRFERNQEAASNLRKGLRDLGLPILVDESDSSPAVFTLPLAQHLKSREVAASLQRKGIWIASESSYLVARNWVQVCLMGEISGQGIQRLLDELKRLIV